MVGQGEAARSGDHGVDGHIARLRQRVPDQAAQGALDVGVMSAVVRKYDLAVSVQQGNLDRRGSDINSKCIVFRNQV